MSKKRRRRRRLNPILAYPIWVLMAPYRLLVWLYHQTVGRFIHGVRRRVKKGQSRFGAVMRVLGDIALFPFTLFFSFLWMVVVEWSSSRQARLFLQGLPAVIFGLGTVGAIAFSYWYPKERLVRSYEIYAIDAVREEKFEEARICYEKLAVLKEGYDEYPYRVAALLFEEGDEARAVGIMQSLAPLDPLEPPGFAPAHLWLWRHIMTQDEVTLTMRAQAKRHLQRAIEADPEDPNVRLLYARTLIREGNAGEAKGYFEELADKDPDIRMEYAEALRASYRTTNNEADEAAALREVSLAQEVFAATVKRDPLNLKAWIRLHQCFLFKREYAQAFEVLRQAQLATGNEDLRQAQARVLVAWSDRMIKDGGLAPNLDAVIKLLEQALALAPNDQSALALLVFIVNSDEIDSEEAIKLLQEKLADTKAPAMVHFLLGSKYAQIKDYERALFHFEQARSLSPQTAAVLNNMAWVLANMPPGEEETEADKKERMDQALGLINQAIEGDPNRPTFYDTRGQILAQLGDYKGALNDLERAMPAMDNKSAKFHEALATCYENLGQADIAKVHHEKAAEILSRAEPQANN